MRATTSKQAYSYITTGQSRVIGVSSEYVDFLVVI